MEVGKNQNISKKFGYLLELIIKIWRLVEFYLFSKSDEFGPFFHGKSFL
jgi:hypothetical protein